MVRPDEITNNTNGVEDVNDNDSTVDKVRVSNVGRVEVTDVDDKGETREDEDVDFRVSKDPEEMLIEDNVTTVSVRVEVSREEKDGYSKDREDTKEEEADDNNRVSVGSM